MIQQDSISKLLGALAISLSFYLATIELTALTLFPPLLIVSSYVLQRKFKVEDEDTYISELEFGSLSKYTLLAIISALLMARITRGDIVEDLLSFTPAQAALVGITTGIAEEEFFRGWFLDYFLQSSGGEAFTSIFFSSLAFMAYHFAIYGTSLGNLLYVVSAGVAFGFVAWKTQRVSTSMIAHATVNAIAFGFFGHLFDFLSVFIGAT